MTVLDSPNTLLEKGKKRHKMKFKKVTELPVAFKEEITCKGRKRKLLQT